MYKFLKTDTYFGSLDWDKAETIHAFSFEEALNAWLLRHMHELDSEELGFEGYMTKVAIQDGSNQVRNYAVDGFYQIIDLDAVSCVH